MITAYQFGGKLEPKKVDKVIKVKKGNIPISLRGTSSVSKIFLLRI
jgi:hypothetical protein